MAAVSSSALNGPPSSVSLLPLLTRRVVVERLEVDGLRMALLRDKAGKLNADDLLDPGSEATPASAVTPFELDVGALTVRGALTDRRAERPPARVRRAGPRNGAYRPQRRWPPAGHDPPDPELLPDTF